MKTSHWILIGVIIALLLVLLLCNKSGSGPAPSHVEDKSVIDSLEQVIRDREEREARNVDSIMVGYFEVAKENEELRKQRVPLWIAAENSRLKGDILVLRLRQRGVVVPADCDSLANEFTILSETSKEINKNWELSYSNQSRQIEDLGRVVDEKEQFNKELKGAFDTCTSKYNDLYSDYKTYTKKKVQVFAGPQAMYGAKIVYFGAEIALKDKRDRMYELGAVWNKNTHYTAGVKFLITFKK